jgi:predicted DNA-binding protein YlxM (UPF0122 family)
MEKLQHPELSYSEIGKKFKCKKQNVLYHLQKAAAEFPELESALLVDQRFNKNAA